MAETPCPVNAPPGSSSQLDETQLIIASSKRLRSLFQLPEQRTCAVCPFSETCSQKDEPAKGVEGKSKSGKNAQIADLGDVFNVLAGLYLSEESVRNL